MALSLRPYVKPAPEKPKMKLYSKKGAKSIKQIFAILNKAKKKNDPDHDPEDYLIGKKVYGKVSGIKGFDVTIKDAKTKKKIIINTDRADGMEVGKSYVFKIDYLDGFNKKCIKASEPDSTVS